MFGRGILLSGKIKFEIASILVLLFSILAFYYRLISGFNGETNFGNYVFPTNINIFKQFFIFWNPYYQGGSLISNPQGEIYYTIALYLTFPVFYLFGSIIASKFLIILSTFFLSLSGYFLIKENVDSELATLIGALFFIFNPLYIQLIANGDFYVFIYQGFVTFSLVFLIRWYKSKKIWNYNLLVSIVFFSFSTALYQLFIMSFVLVTIITVLFLINSGSKDKDLLKSSKRIIAQLAIFIALSMLLVLPFITSSFTLLGTLSGSSSPLTLSDFSSLSNSFTNTILMHNYFPNIGFESVKLAFGSIVYFLWNSIYEMMIFFILCAFIILRPRRIMLFISLSVIVSSLLSSGTDSPISFLNVYLFTHFSIYRSLNGGFYWSWLLMSPLYSIGLSISLTALNKEAHSSHLSSSKVFQKHFKRKVVGQIIKESYIIVTLIILVILILPVVGQGFYGNSYGSGIRYQKTLTSYANIMSYVSGPSNNLNDGTAIFNPDYYITINNNTKNNIINPINTYMSVRIPGLPGYANYPLGSNFYSYWLYSQFYANSTNELAQLFGVMGINYYVALNGSNPFSGNNYLPNSFNANAAMLLNYQKNITKVTTEVGYTVYRSNITNQIASYVSNYTEVIGTDFTLNSMASNGANLSSLALFSPYDISKTNFESFLQNSSVIIFQNNCSLLSLIFPLLESYKLNSKGWNNSEYYENNIASTGVSYFFSLPTNVVVGNANNNLTAKTYIKTKGNFDLLLNYFTMKNVTGNLTVNIAGRKYSINTFQSNQSSNNGELAWNSQDINLQPGNYTITVSSKSGKLNAIQGIYLVPNESLIDYEKNTIKLLNNYAPIILLQKSNSFTRENLVYNSTSYKLSLTKSRSQLPNLQGLSNLVPTGNNIFTNLYNGYLVNDSKKAPILVRVPYDSNLASVNRNTIMVPSFSGTGTIIISTSHQDKVKVTPIYYPYIYYSFIIDFSVISMLVTICTIRWKLPKGKK